MRHRNRHHLREVANPSAIFLSRYEEPIPGSVVMVSREGTRPLLVEVQALVDDAYGNPRRVAIGLDQNRLAMLLAILHRHGGVHTIGQDVFVNVVGGVKVLETGSDLAVLLAVTSSLRGQALPTDLAAAPYQTAKSGYAKRQNTVLSGRLCLKAMCRAKKLKAWKWLGLGDCMRHWQQFRFR